MCFSNPSFWRVINARRNCKYCPSCFIEPAAMSCSIRAKISEILCDRYSCSFLIIRSAQLATNKVSLRVGLYSIRLSMDQNDSLAGRGRYSTHAFEFSSFSSTKRYSTRGLGAIESKNRQDGINAGNSSNTGFKRDWIVRAAFPR